MRRRWQVVVRVKQYPVESRIFTTAKDVPSILDPFVLGEIVSTDRRYWTRWGAEGRALRLNLPPELMWRAVAERVPS